MSLRTRTLGVLAISLTMIFMAIPSLVPERVRLGNPWIPDSGVQLGLDLQGGIHWLLSVDREQATQRRLEAIAADQKDQAQSYGPLRVVDGPLLEACGATPQRLAELEGDRRIERSSTSGDCVHFALTESEQTRELARAADSAMEVIKRRVSSVQEPLITRQGEDRILVQLPGGDLDPVRARKLITGTTFLEFKGVLAAAETEQQLRDRYPEGLPADTLIVASEGKDEVLLVPKDPILKGDSLEDARLEFERMGQPVVSFTWNAEGTRVFREFTAANVGQRLAAIIDGVAITAPVIRSEIGRTGQIEGNFTQEEATDLSLRLRSGALPVALRIEEERTVGPGLGADSIRSGVLSTLVGGLAVLLLTALYYGRSGLLADLTLVLNLFIVLAFMGGFGATLTLPGLAGLALTIGMAVDSNIIVFERIREELRAGMAFQRAVQVGFRRSFLTIVDANLTTLIAAAVLYYIGRGPIQGFGVTLAVGIGATVFCAVTVTRLLMEHAPKRASITEGIMRLIPADTRINFLGQMRMCSWISVALVSFSLLGWGTFGLNLGIDFKGGTQLQLVVPASASPVDEARMRGAFARAGFDDAEVARLGAPEAREFLIRLPVSEEERPPAPAAAGAEAAPGTGQAAAASAAELESPNSGLVGAIQAALTEELGAPVRFNSIESIGPRVGEEITWSALAAVLITSVLILAYIWLRFDLVYAPGAVAALLHDVIVTIGAFVWFGIEFDQNIVAALLVILGYSINDTVVIYDRIRENVGIRGRARMADIVNESLNQTLSRTLLTSGFTLSVVIALLIFGGPVLRGLSIALLVGMLSGIYSTVYVASAMLIGLERRSVREPA